MPAGGIARRFVARHIAVEFRERGVAAQHVLVREPAERAAADRLGDLLERIGQRQPLRHHHRRDDELRQQRAQMRERLVQPQHDGAIVRRLHRIEPLRQRDAALVAHHPALQRGDAVARPHRLAVVEPQILAQPQRPAAAVVLHQVAFQHLRPGVHRLVATVEQVEHHEPHVPGDLRTGPNRVDAVQRDLRHDAQGLRSAADGGTCERRGNGGRRPQQKAASVHSCVSSRSASEPSRLSRS